MVMFKFEVKYSRKNRRCQAPFQGVDPAAARGINLLYFLPTAGTGLLFHRKSGLLDRAALRQAVPWGLLTAAGGA